jgi:hypothetical protein
MNESIKRKLERMGINPHDLGTHSIRKGSATYCSSGSTASPCVSFSMYNKRAICHLPVFTLSRSLRSFSLSKHTVPEVIKDADVHIEGNKTHGFYSVKEVREKGQIEATLKENKLVAIPLPGEEPISLKRKEKIMNYQGK